MPYKKNVWINDSPPFINATNLNGIETGIAGAHQTVDDHVGSRDGHPVATTAFNGLMVGADKGKLGRALDVETSQRVVYVSPTGSDTTGDGTSLKPWATIQFAVNQSRPFLQPRNGTSRYKIVCKTGTYNETVTIPQNYFSSGAFTTGGGIWITSETSLAADVLITSTVNDSAVLAYGSCFLEHLTIGHDYRAVIASGSPSTAAYVKDCVLRRNAATNGGDAAIFADIALAICHNCSSVTGRLFANGLSATTGGTIAKAGGVPAGATAAEFVVYGGVIR